MAEGPSKKQIEEEYNKLKAEQLASEQLAEENLAKKLNEVKDLSGVIQDNLKTYANSLDKSGVLAELFGNKMSVASKATIMTQLAFTAIASAALAANKSITQLQNNLGINASRAAELRLSQSETAFFANDLRITTETLIDAQNELNKSFQTTAIFSNEIA